jgi:hypothetical protein
MNLVRKPILIFYLFYSFYIWVFAVKTNEGLNMTMTNSITDPVHWDFCLDLDINFLKGHRSVARSTVDPKQFLLSNVPNSRTFSCRLDSDFFFQRPDPVKMVRIRQHRWQTLSLSDLRREFQCIDRISVDGLGWGGGGGGGFIESPPHRTQNNDHDRNLVDTLKFRLWIIAGSGKAVLEIRPDPECWPTTAVEMDRRMTDDKCRL